MDKNGPIISAVIEWLNQEDKDDISNIIDSLGDSKIDNILGIVIWACFAVAASMILAAIVERILNA